MLDFLDNPRFWAPFYISTSLIGAVQIGNQYEFARVDGDYGPLWFMVPILFVAVACSIRSAEKILKEVLDSRDALRLDSSHQPNND